jgi:ribonuclease P/MRP protein subunit POP3
MSDICSLVATIGEHRKTQIHPSKGRKRKRDINAAPDERSKLPAPATASHILVGLNSVTRHLEIQAASTAPPTAPSSETPIDEQDKPTRTNDKESATPPRALSIVILTHPQPSLSPSHAHIPTLLHLANLRRDPGTVPSEPTRLVCLATSNDARLASALHIPRVGAIGILEGAPGANALEEYARKHVGLTACAWVDEALRSEWRGLNVQQG